MPKRNIAALVAAHQLKTLTGREHAILCGRASAGIQAALTVIGAVGRPVLIPANTCYIVLWAVIRSGAVPVLVEIDPHTGNITPQTLTETGITQPAAVIPCHLYGIPAEITAISAWAKRHGAFVIEDGALALGTIIDGKPAGSHGDMSVFSFGTGKIVDIGLGGAALTGDTQLADELTRAMNAFPVWKDRLDTLSYQWNELYFALHRFERSTPALVDLYPRWFDLYADTVSYRLSASHWRTLADALDELPVNIAHRRELTLVYHAALADRSVRAAELSLWRYPIFVPPDQREDVLRDLWAGGVQEATCWYPSLQAMHAALCPDAPKTSTPHADLWGASVINLPLDATTHHADTHQAIKILHRSTPHAASPS